MIIWKMCNASCVTQKIFFLNLLSTTRSNKNQEDIDDGGGHGNGHGVRKIKITAIQQVNI